MISINPKVSIIIVNYNGALFLDNLFSSLQAQTFKNFEVIFVDNASTDNSLEIAESFAEKNDLDVKIVGLLDNYGFCKGNNIGVKYAEGQYIVCLNNDTYVDEKWLEELMEVMESDPSVGICQSKIIEPKIVVYGNFVGVYGKNRLGSIPSIKKDEAVFEGFFFASGASFIIRKDLIERLGYLFDERQFTGDLDLSWRVRLLGFKIMTSLRSKCFHYRAKATKIILPSIVNVSYFLYKDKLRTFVKNYSTLFLLKRIGMFIFLGLLGTAVYYSVFYKKPIVYSLIKAVFSFLKNFRDTWMEHVKVQTMRNVSDNEIERHMLPYPAEIYFWRKILNERG